MQKVGFSIKKHLILFMRGSQSLRKAMNIDHILRSARKSNYMFKNVVKPKMSAS